MNKVLALLAVLLTFGVSALAMYIDQMPAADLDFTAQTARLTAAMDKDVMAQAGADNQDNLYWGTDINFDKADVDAATRSLYVRYDDKGGDFTEEIAIYEKAIETEKAKLAAKAQAEAEAMAGLADILR